MTYITIKRYRRDDKRGRFNIPYGTRLEGRDGCLWYNGRDVCGDHSAVMREYFARDDDGRGLKRGKLSHDIVSALKGGADRWAAVWNDSLCQKYRKPVQEDYWLWSIEFFNAPIADLEYIADLIGLKRGA